QQIDSLQRDIGRLHREMGSNLVIERPNNSFPETMPRSEGSRKRILVTGGTGFVGSHLVDKLMKEGHEVIALDNYFTGRKKNVEQWIGHPNFELVHHDVVNPYYVEVDQIYHLASPASPPHYMYNPVKTLKTNTIGTVNMLGLARRVKARMELVHHDVVNPYYVEVDQIYHLASPASPPHYMYNPVKTLKTNTIGTVNMLGLARRVKARMLLASTSEIYGDPEVHPQPETYWGHLLASTSEIYGDPEVHPQPETYWGHVNTIGPRACYDEGKRVAESLMVAYQKQEKVDIRIARIFNTFGPRMHMNDGRVVSNFILQALQNQPITIYGEGAQTRSFQYVDDLVDGLIALMNSNTTLPVNIGNPEEYTIKDFAVVIRDIIGSKSEIINHPKVEDDPQQRRPDIRRAAELLNWKPKVSMRDGLKKTIEYFQKELESEKARI
uniref:UDP-glucuronate decarboxylase n=1 Tax=Panagrolaimus sp. ES5 TaxID=591445 RepID=A0AC34G6L2_9BILA